MSRYASLYTSPQGSGDARPTALSIVEDECLVNALPDKVVLVIGTLSGLGVDIVHAFVVIGARVFCGIRSLSRG